MGAEGRPWGTSLRAGPRGREEGSRGVRRRDRGRATAAEVVAPVRPRGDSRGATRGWEEPGPSPRTGYGTAAESVASADVAARAAVRDVAPLTRE